MKKRWEKSRFPKNRDHLRNVAMMSRYMASGETFRDRSKQLLGRAVAIDRARVRDLSLDRMARLDLSFDLSELSDWYERSGDLHGAVKTFDEVLAIRKELVAQDAKDEQAQDRLFYALWREGKLYAALNEPSASHRYYREAVELGDRILHSISQPSPNLLDQLRFMKEALGNLRTPGSDL